MRIGHEGIQLLKQFEGCKLVAYQDSVKIWTIGYGNTMYENGQSVRKGDVITQERAEQLLDTITGRFDSAVSARVKKTVNQNQFDALVVFTYNVGIGNLDKSTLLKKVNANPNDPTIKDEFPKYNKAGGKVLNGLTRRRIAESVLYFK
jgi:lysozyme